MRKNFIEGIIMALIVLMLGIAFIAVGFLVNAGNVFTVIMTICGCVFVIYALQYIAKKIRCRH